MKYMRESSSYPKYFVGIDSDGFEDLGDLKFFRVDSGEELENIKNFSGGFFTIPDEEITDLDKFIVFISSNNDIVIVPISDRAFLDEYEFEGGTYQMDIFTMSYVRNHSITWEGVQEEYGEFFGD